MSGRELASFVSSFASMSDPLVPIRRVGRADPAHRPICCGPLFCNAEPRAPCSIGLPVGSCFDFILINPATCWHSLAQSLGMRLLSSFPTIAPEMLGWYVLTFTERSASARIYRCSISPRSIQGIVIYIFTRDDVVCKVVY